MNFSANLITTIIGPVFTKRQEESKVMPLKENLNDSAGIGTSDLQITAASPKREWARPECRRLHISHETAGGDVVLATEDSFPTGPEPS